MTNTTPTPKHDNGKSQRRWLYHNADKRRAYKKQEKQANRELYIEWNRRHNERLAELPSTLTEQEFESALDYFDYRCAYCRASTAKLGRDHFVGVGNENCPGTVASNVLPCCQSCNSQKGNRDARTWLVRRFGQEIASLILADIQRYFDTLTDNGADNARVTVEHEESK